MKKPKGTKETRIGIFKTSTGKLERRRKKLLDSGLEFLLNRRKR